MRIVVTVCVALLFAAAPATAEALESKHLADQQQPIAQSMDPIGANTHSSTGGIPPGEDKEQTVFWVSALSASVPIAATLTIFTLELITGQPSGDVRLLLLYAGPALVSLVGAVAAFISFGVADQIVVWTSDLSVQQYTWLPIFGCGIGAATGVSSCLVAGLGTWVLNSLVWSWSAPTLLGRPPDLKEILVTSSIASTTVCVLVAGALVHAQLTEAFTRQRPRPTLRSSSHPERSLFASDARRAMAY